MNETRDHATPNDAGYRTFVLGRFTFSRDEHFARIEWTANGRKLSHTMSADAFLRALMRDVAWKFFYGSVEFDDVFGTRNLYGKVELHAGRGQPEYERCGLNQAEALDTELVMDVFKTMLHDWTNSGFDPFVAPLEAGPSWIGKKVGDNTAAIERSRGSCSRMPGLPGDVPLRTDGNHFPVNRAFLDVPQDEPEVDAEPGFEDEVHAFNLFAYVSRSDVTWNPSASSVCKHSVFCVTAEEHIMPIKHANDRIEWFVQLSDSIEWTIEDRDTGRPRAKLAMRAGDIAAIPADAKHQGFARRRAMLLVWENADPDLPNRHASDELPPSMAGEFMPRSG